MGLLLDMPLHSTQLANMVPGMPGNSALPTAAQSRSDGPLTLGCIELHLSPACQVSLPVGHSVGKSTTETDCA